MIAKRTMSKQKPASDNRAAQEFASVFGRLRQILAEHASQLSVTEDSPRRYCLEGKTGPAAVRAWGGQTRRPTLPVAWAEVGKSYVSFHLMPVYGHPDLLARTSQRLKARMQGKSCFNFTTSDEPLFNELGQLTAEAIGAFKRAGFVA
jgi:hypothetical protein